jgi:hypothetical protein
MAIQLLTSHHLCIVCSCSVHLFMSLVSCRCSIALGSQILVPS